MESLPKLIKMKKNTKKRLFMFVALNSAVVLIYLIVWFLSNLPAKVNRIKKPSTPLIIKSVNAIATKKHLNVTLKLSRNNNTKYILYWLPMWDSKTFFFGHEGFELFKFCKFKNCYATHNKNMMPVENFHAIVFHASQYNQKIHGKPKIRKSHQRYIFANMETPVRFYPENLQRFRYFYNWTMTYRRDSDIFRPYGYVIKRATNYTMPNREAIKNKTNVAAWFVSNCRTINRRQELYKNLRRYINIDVYGSCGKLKCPKELHESAPKCYDLIETKYKFYFSFENSHCKDYVSEKMYRVLERNIVPIVYGNNDYGRIAPPDSVIVADNYTSAKDLADYMIFLDKNPEEYLKYFKWKRSYYVERNFNRTVCKLCKMLNNASEPVKVYEDILVWWLGTNHSYCKIGEGLPSISIPIQ